MIRNPDRLPTAAIGKRVRGKLRDGSTFSDWAADGRGCCRWTLTGCRFDILFYEVIA